MRYSKYITIVCVAALCLLVVLGCKRRSKPTTSVQGPQGSLAVAAFYQPQVRGELLGGYLPDNPQAIKAKVLTELDAHLAEALVPGTAGKYFTPGQMGGCTSLAIADAHSSNAFDYWLKIGKCMDVDFLLVPHVTYWRERDTRTSTPASVTMDMFLIQIDEERLAARYHFEETQRSLTENLLEADKFVERKGRWITAMELANEGLKEGVRRFGL